ncbi:MAG: hypothetical protein AAF678_06135 [Pseudomonadota bacterium]
MNGPFMLRLILSGGFDLTGPDDIPVSVTARRGMALLAYLAVSPGLSRSREEIMALLWSDRPESQARGSLRQVLTALRRELGTEALIIDTARVALNPDHIELVPADEREFLSGFQLKDAAFEDWLRDERLRQEALRTEIPPSASVPENPALAVLPFDSLSTEPDDVFFADGITQDIITELSRFYGFYVIAHRTSLQYRNKAMSAYEIGKDLEVNYIVDGSVRKAGDRVRITAELIEVEDETHLWADRFDHEAGDILVIQDEVAREIAKTIPGHIEEDRIERVRHRPKQTLTDYEHVLMGEIEREKDSCSTEAKRHFEAALRLNPSNARALANLALWTAYQVYNPDVCFGDVQTRVLELGETSLELEPNDPINLAVLSSAYLTVGEHNESRRYVEKALRINANHYTVMGYAARCLAWHGESDRALDLLALYALYDPFSGRASVELNFEVLTLARQFEEAIAATSRLADDLPDIASELAAVCALAGRTEEAAALRTQAEANTSNIQNSEDRLHTLLRLCANEPERALWLDGYRAAGFGI